MKTPRLVNTLNSDISTIYFPFMDPAYECGEFFGRADIYGKIFPCFPHFRQAILISREYYACLVGFALVVNRLSPPLPSFTFFYRFSSSFTIFHSLSPSFIVRQR